MCFPFQRCDLCEDYLGLFNSPFVIARIDQPSLYFCSVECRAKHYERRNRSIPEPRKYDEQSRVRKGPLLATGRYVPSREYHAF